jgi:tetratricopeptide (TPR) repeat protein
MDDGPIGGAWTLDPETRTVMRLERVRAALGAGAWTEVVLEAEELLDEQPDHAEALQLLGDALLHGGDHELARQVFEHRVSLDGGSVKALIGLAVSAFHLTDLPTTLETAREAVRQDPGNARAHYFLGLALERSEGRAAEALTELSVAAQLDPGEYPLPLAVKKSEWIRLYERSVARLPPPLREVWEGVEVRLEEWPDFEELRHLTPPVSPLVGAMYVGEPPEETATNGGRRAQPEAIRLFTRNLARAGEANALVVELADLLQDEALDWLGIDLEDLEES